MKKIWSNNVLATIIVVLMLVISISSAFTIKLGEDTDGQKWFGTNDLITNSNGKAWIPNRDNLQAAIYDLNSTGGIVYLPSGIIAIDETVKLIGGVYLEGVGRNSQNCTELDADAGVSVILNHDGISGTTTHRYGGVRGIYFNGNGVAGDVGVNKTNSSLWATIEDCTFYNFEFAIRQIDTNGLIVDNCKIYGTTSAGIDSNYSASNSGALHVSNCDFNPSGGYSIRLTKAYDCLIDGNWFEYSGVTGSHIYVYDSKNCKIVNNMVGTTGGSTTDYGVYADDSDGLVINSNVFGDDGFHIYLDTNCDNAVISNNRINDGVEGIHLETDCLGSSIEGNSIYNTAGYGIDCGSNYVSISDNGIYTTTVNDGIFVDGSRCSITGNTIYDADSDGIDVKSFRSTYTGNIVYGSGRYGFYIENGKDENVITGNIVRESADVGIRILAGENNSICNNVVVDNLGVGISEEGASNNNIIVGNILEGNTGDEATIVGAHTRFTDNAGWGGHTIPTHNLTAVEGSIAGTMWYDTANNKIWIYDGSEWQYAEFT